jgi:hypothetical protein
MDTTTPLHIIYTEAAVFVSRREFNAWQEVQAAHADFKTSLGPWPAAEVIEYLENEYGPLLPSAQEQITVFLATGSDTGALSMLKKQDPEHREKTREALRSTDSTWNPRVSGDGANSISTHPPRALARLKL